MSGPLEANFGGRGRRPHKTTVIMTGPLEANFRGRGSKTSQNHGSYDGEGGVGNWHHQSHGDRVRYVVRTCAQYCFQSVNRSDVGRLRPPACLCLWHMHDKHRHAPADLRIPCPPRQKSLFQVCEHSRATRAESERDSSHTHTQSIIVMGVPQLRGDLLCRSESGCLHRQACVVARLRIMAAKPT